MDQIRLEDPRHKKIVELVKNSFKLSYKYVEGRYPKWEEADQMDRSYIDTSATDNKGKKLNPFDRTVFVPISRAIKDVILTYFHNVFFSNRPFIPIDGRGPEDVTPAKMQEIILDYQLEQQNMHLIGNEVDYVLAAQIHSMICISLFSVVKYVVSTFPGLNTKRFRGWFNLLLLDTESSPCSG